MLKIFTEKGLQSPEFFIRDVVAQHALWVCYLSGRAKKHQRHLIDDVLQDFYCNVYLKWESIPKNNPACTLSFLRKMLYHEFIDRLRRERAWLVHLDDVLALKHPSGNLYHLCFEDFWEEQFSHLSRLLSELDFQILQLKMQGYPSKEIAELLQVKTNYVDVRLHRIRKQLQPLFTPEAS
jgi:RNA polymerase sigma factor (sigma-70 family)